MFKELLVEILAVGQSEEALDDDQIVGIGRWATLGFIHDANTGLNVGRVDSLRKCIVSFLIINLSWIVEGNQEGRKPNRKSETEPKCAKTEPVAVDKVTGETRNRRNRKRGLQNESN